MVTLETVLDVIPALSVLIALIYYTRTLRNTEQERRREQILLRHQMHDLPYMESWVQLMGVDFNNHEEFVEKVRNNTALFAKYVYVGTRYQNIGLLLKEKMVEPDLLFQVFSPRSIIRFWERFGWHEKILRERANDPEHYEAFEYLYNEAKKRYPDINPEASMLHA